MPKVEGTKRNVDTAGRGVHKIKRSEGKKAVFQLKEERKPSGKLHMRTGAKKNAKKSENT